MSRLDYTWGLKTQDSRLKRKNRSSLGSRVSGLGSTQGFTLIELVVVAAVLAVVMVSAVPHLQRGWVSAQTERTAFQVAQSLRAARTLAITGTRMVDWIWDGEGRRVCVGSSEAVDCAAADPHDRLAGPRRVPSPLRLAVTHDGQAVSRVRFFPDGTSQSSTVVVNDAASPRYTIVIDGSTSQVAVHAATLASPR